MSLKHRALPDHRRGSLKRLLAVRSGLRFLEAHNGLSAIVASTAEIEALDGGTFGFDGLWESSLTDSASKGLPDAEIVGVESRLATIQEILNVTDKPLIVDGDTGGDGVHFEYLCSKLEAMGVSAVIVEDKQFPKRNSLEAGVSQQLEDPEIFCSKIQRGHSALLTDEFLIIARLESLIANRGLDDALQRAALYLAAGADGLMIHSKSKSPEEIFEFLRRYRQLCEQLGYRRPIICVPTTYNRCYERELFEAGADIAIHANHLLRAAFKAMQKVARLVLENQRSLEADAYCSSVSDIFDAVGFLDVKAKDAIFGTSKIRSIVLAAGEPGRQFLEDFGAIPPASLMLEGKSVLQWQLEAFNRAGVEKAVVVKGYHEAVIAPIEAIHLSNPEFGTSKSLQTLMLSQAYMDDGFFFTVSDIVFADRLIREMKSASRDILLAIDNSPSFLEKRLNKPTIDLVQVGFGAGTNHRVLDNSACTIKRIGNKIAPQHATHEFIGIAFFSRRGAEILRTVYQESQERYVDRPFQEADGIVTADINDIIQEIIDRGYEVHGFEINSGWIEIQNAEDYDAAGQILHSP